MPFGRHSVRPPGSHVLRVRGKGLRCALLVAGILFLVRTRSLWSFGYLFGLGLSSISFVGPKSSVAEAATPPLQVQPEPLRSRILLESTAFWKVATLFNAACWGATYISTKAGIDALAQAEVPDASAVFQLLRFSLCAMVMLPWLFRSACSESAMRSVMVGGLNALGYLSVSLAYACGTTGSKAAFFASLQAIVVAVGSSILSKKWQMKTACSALLAVIGVGILELKGPLNASLGDLLCLGCPLFLGLGWFVLSSVMKNYPQDAIPSVAVQFVVFTMIFAAWLFSGILSSEGSAGVVKWFQELPALLQTPNLLAPLFFTVTFGSVFSMFLANRAVQILSSSDVSLIVASEPLWATLVAFVVLGEVLGFADYLGGALIVAALLCNELWDSEPSPTTSRGQKDVEADSDHVINNEDSRESQNTLKNGNFQEHQR